MTNNQDVKLLPCLFCGEAQNKSGLTIHPQLNRVISQTYSFTCVNNACAARTADHFGTPFAALDAWNTRAPTPREQELEAKNKEIARKLAGTYADITILNHKLVLAEAQNKALWELVGECEKGLDCSLKCNMETFQERKPAVEALAAIQKAKEGIETPS